MEERRFDDLTRTLGMARSRRQVVKGLLGGLVAAVAGRASAPTLAAAGGTCSSATVTQCYATAQQKRDDALAGLCGAQTLEGERGKVGEAVDALCTLQVNRWYFGELAKCDHAQCRNGGTCINDRCCEGDHCCDPGVQCGGTSASDPPTFCCPEGSSCCNDKCCGAGNTCCRHTDVGLPFGIREPSFSYTCTDLNDDPKNCGACDNVCKGDQICQNGTCTCPTGTSACSGPFNVACCAPNEYCQSSAFGGVQCVPKCSPCQVYDPNDSVQPCKPVECDVCQSCDPQSGQCIPSADGTVCGSGLACCGGQCVDDCGSGGTLHFDTCTCQCSPLTCPAGQVQDPDTCQCVACERPPDCVPPLIWDSTDCHCQNTCTESCEPDGNICCTNKGPQNSQGYYYCCPSDSTCCDSILGCCFG